MKRNFQTPNKKVILTVGHSTHDIDVFIAILRAHGIERIVDIRSTLSRVEHRTKILAGIHLRWSS
jgi:hypothetical protein